MKNGWIKRVYPQNNTGALLRCLYNAKMNYSPAARNIFQVVSPPVVMRYILFFACIIFLVIVAGCTTQTPITATTTPTPISTTLLTPEPTNLSTPVATTIPNIPMRSSGSLLVTVNSIQTSWVSDNPYYVPPAGYQFVLVDFSVKNLGYRNGYTFNPAAVWINDPDNNRYTYDNASYSLPDVFESMTIPYHATRGGKLVFSVPTSQKPGTQYQLAVPGNLILM